MSRHVHVWADPSLFFSPFPFQPNHLTLSTHSLHPHTHVLMHDHFPHLVSERE
jgi:hypothetical protein